MEILPSERGNTPCESLHVHVRDIDDRFGRLDRFDGSDLPVYFRYGKSIQEWSLWGEHAIYMTQQLPADPANQVFPIAQGKPRSLPCITGILALIELWA